MTGPELASLRRAHHWTQRELGVLLGVTEVSVRRYEIGLRVISPTIERLLEILTSPEGQQWLKRTLYEKVIRR